MKTKILKEIIKYETIIIHRHVRPDPDAIGSQAGLACLIKDNFPNKNVYVVGEESETLTFLHRMDNISDDIYDGALVIVCDTANQERISDERYKLGDQLIKIDHHPNVDPYGDIVWVDTTASSTSEMIVSLSEADKDHRFQLSEHSARLLYAGIIGDTGRFLFSNTTQETFKKAGLLINYSFDRQDLVDQMNKTSLRLIRLNGYIFEHFELSDDGVGVMKVTLELCGKYGVLPSEASLLVNSFSDVEGIKSWVLFVEEEDQIRVRLRSKGPIINELAKKYNGGGHPLASGATVYSWEEAEGVIADLHEAVTNSHIL